MAYNKTMKWKKTWQQREREKKNRKKKTVFIFDIGATMLSLKLFRVSVKLYHIIVQFRRIGKSFELGNILIEKKNREKKIKWKSQKTVNWIGSVFCEKNGANFLFLFKWTDRSNEIRKKNES